MPRDAITLPDVRREVRKAHARDVSAPPRPLSTPLASR